PAGGYWLAQGGEIPEVSALTNAPQCPSRCFMGGASDANNYLNWTGKNWWIDRRDYAHLLDELAVPLVAPPPPGGTVVVTGVLADGLAAIADVFVEPSPGEPDLLGDGAAFALRFLDAKGDVLAQY